MLADGSRINAFGSFTVNGLSRALAAAALAGAWGFGGRRWRDHGRL
ncbi:MAG: hypothetical protein IT536_15985 [Hyphomicrobiales bacterium]|nr:hypothetical protein [Hyphomicrobiales bacterium]